MSGFAEDARPTGPLVGKIEFQFRGDPVDLGRLREVLADVGVFVQVDRELRESAWAGEGMVLGALIVPAADRVGSVMDE